jgi:uncharacterized coiled-coil DUF342 family protein
MTDHGLLLSAVSVSVASVTYAITVSIGMRKWLDAALIQHKKDCHAYQDKLDVARQEADKMRNGRLATLEQQAATRQDIAELKDEIRELRNLVMELHKPMARKDV